MSTTSLRVSVSIRSPFERSATPASYPYTACRCRCTIAKLYCRAPDRGTACGTPRPAVRA
ncbi:hypothetical protein BFK09_003361 [Salmonella enterica subsp. enterica serovar Florian]|nr:hypothetical protein [Salmonella enterica subsp. enterica serovar Florian]